MWSFGCCVEVLWTHKQVYSGHKRPAGEVLRLVMEGEMAPSLPHGSLLAALLKSCCDHDPSLRPTFKTISMELQAEDLAMVAMRLPPGPGRQQHEPASGRVQLAEVSKRSRRMSESCPSLPVGSKERSEQSEVRPEQSEPSCSFLSDEVGDVSATRQHTRASARVASPPRRSGRRAACASRSVAACAARTPARRSSARSARSRAAARPAPTWTA